MKIKSFLFWHNIIALASYSCIFHTMRYVENILYFLVLMSIYLQESICIELYSDE